jgi:endonuclease/exonuclease/phosphatase family metal-dependent hydrolase
VRLLLDEHYSPTIAEELRKAGHDVVSVQETDNLRGLDDRELWVRASAERRALMTENVADFMALVREAAAQGDRHLGVVFTSPRSMPRGVRTIGLYVDVLNAFLREHPGEDALLDQVAWLGPAVTS